MRKGWWKGFLGFFSIYGGIGIYNGDWMSAVWLLWIIWFVYFIPEKKAGGEGEKEDKAYDRSTNEKVGNNKKNGNGKLKGIVS